MSDLTDDSALERAAQGDTEAFSVLYERYVKRIYNYIYYLCKIFYLHENFNS